MSESRGHGPPDTPADWDAIARYLAGESEPAEASAVEAWLAEHPEDGELVAALDRTIDLVAVAPATGDIDVEAALRRVTELRTAPDVRPIRRPNIPVARPSTWRSTALRAAAAVVVLATGAFWWRTMQSTQGARTYATGVGQRDSVTLADGSRIVLGPSSRLVVARGYGKSERRVELDGEGYFEVEHDEAHAFTVRAGRATIRDMGTAFTIRTDDANRVRVAVAEGSVQLDGPSAGPGVVLQKGDIGVVQASGDASAERGTATSEDVAWTDGRLVFREAPLSEVAAELRRWYGLELRVDDAAIADRHLTTSWMAADSADRVLKVLGLALGATVERRGDTAVVHAATPRP